MYKAKLDVQMTNVPDLFPRSVIDFGSIGREQLATAVCQMLPPDVIPKLSAPASWSVPIIVCTHARGHARPLVVGLALFSLLESGIVDAFEEMDGDLIPFHALNGKQLSEWFTQEIEQYYLHEIMRPVHADGEINDAYSPSHTPVVPIVEFVSPSLEQSYLRLVCALADLDDDGCAPDEVDGLANYTHDAVAPAGVQFIHFADKGKVQSCFVSFAALFADARSWVMF